MKFKEAKFKVLIRTTDKQIIMIDYNCPIEKNDIICKRKEGNKYTMKPCTGSNYDAEWGKVIGAVEPIERKMENGKLVYYFDTIKPLNYSFCKEYLKNNKQ